MSDKLSDCPFCRASASIGKIGRDWWELKAEHDDECALDADHVLRAPQTPEGRAWLVAAWNRRASPAPAIPAGPDDEAVSAVRACLEQHAVYFSRSSIEEIVTAARKAAPAISESEDAIQAVRVVLEQNAVYFARSTIEEIVTAARKGEKS